MVKSYRYDLIGATFSGVNIHPQLDMKQHGFHIIGWHPAPIADCILVCIDNSEEIKDLPSYIVEIDGSAIFC